MSEGDPGKNGTKTTSGFSLASIIRSMGEQSELDRPFIPLVGGARFYILLLYASVIVVASVEFFASQEYFAGNWELYNTYVFVVSGVFVFLGMVMLFSSKAIAPEEYILPIPRPVLGVVGFALLAISGIVLAIYGKDLGGWAILLSVTLMYGLSLMMLGVPSIGNSDGMRLMLYSTGLILMILVPVHEAFGVAQSDKADYPWTLLNLALLTVGMTMALFAAQGFETRDGYLGAWLMGAMAIFLIAFHEQVNIVASGSYSPYDRTLALVGITFSFLPLVMYIWREKVYFFLWSRLKSANMLIEAGDYKGALIHADAAIKQCSRAGIEDRFALPWTLKADAHYRMKEYDRAKVYYENALQINPKDAVTWNHMGNMYAFEGKQELAMKAFDRAIEIEPTNAYAWNNKGAIYQSLRMYEDALISFDKSIGFDPRGFDAHLNKAKLLAKMGHSNEAVPEYQAASEINPASIDAKEGVYREFFRAKCLDQIDGWEQLGMDTTALKGILDQDPTHFARRSKEFLAKIVEQQEQLKVLPSSEHIDVNAAIKNILAATEGEGATLENLAKATSLSWHDLILPLALLMETEHVYFRTVGKKQVYVSKGKAPDKPPEPPPLPQPKPAAPRVKIAAKGIIRPGKSPVKKSRNAQKNAPPPQEPRIPLRRKLEIPESTSSILVFNRIRKKKK